MVTRLVFLGGGNMAEAIFAGLVTNPLYTIEVIQHNPDKAAHLQQCYPQLSVKPKLEEKLAATDILVLAVKPQHAREACGAINHLIQNCLIVSVMAGVSVATLSAWCHNPRLIRTMPNTPTQVGKGVTAIYAAPTITPSEQQQITAIFAEQGLTYNAATESLIDKIVPITSSAIAFIYYFIEGIIANAIAEYGFDAKQANSLVRQVLSGSASLLEHNPEITVSQQRARVTSQKGATEQGIISFQHANLHQIIATAMQDCYQRTLELGQDYATD